MNKHVPALFLILITTLLSTISMQSMEKEITLSEKDTKRAQYEKEAQEAHEYNQEHPFPDDIFNIIFSRCQKEGDIMYIVPSKRNNNSYSSERKIALITHTQIQTLLDLNRTCKRFNKLMSFKEIVAFCKTLSDDTKNSTLKITIPNIDKNYDPSPWIDIPKWVEAHPLKLADNYDNNLICLALIRADANINAKYRVVNQKTLKSSELSVLSQAIYDTPFLVAAALKHGANANVKDAGGTPFFFYAKTVAMAQLFLTKGGRRILHGSAGKDVWENNVMWHILAKEYPSALMTFYLKNDVTIERAGKTIVHALIDLLEGYIDADLSNEFLEKSRILLTEIGDSHKKNTIHDKHGQYQYTLLDELIWNFSNAEMNGKNAPEFKEKAVALFRKHGFKTKNEVMDEQEINEAIQFSKNNQSDYVFAHDRAFKGTIQNSVNEQKNNKESLEELILARVLEQSKKEMLRSIIKLVKEKNIDDVRTLLEQRHADIDEQDNVGNTSLIWATINNDRSMVKLLLEHGANPTLPNSINCTALEIAMENSNDDVAALLIDAAEKYDDC